jgi:hypothetical protein
MTRVCCGVVLGLALALSAAQAQSLADAKIVFVGVVESTNSTTFADVAASSRTTVVRVESIVTKPRELSLFRAGDRVTLELREGAAAPPGTRARFYAVSWMAGGEGQLALREVGREPVAAAETATLSNATAARALADRQLLDRTNRAAVVVVGRVVAVRSAPALEAAATDRTTRVSEHDPKWKDASILVTSAIKGAAANQTVVVRFPSSDDVAWRDAPKFVVGQSGTFVFDQALEAGAFESGSVLMAVSKDQVLPARDGQRLRRLLAPPR